MLSLFVSFNYFFSKLLILMCRHFLQTCHPYVSPLLSNSLSSDPLSHFSFILLLWCVHVYIYIGTNVEWLKGSCTNICLSKWFCILQAKGKPYKVNECFWVQRENTTPYSWRECSKAKHTDARTFISWRSKPASRNRYCFGCIRRRKCLIAAAIYFESPLFRVSILRTNWKKGARLFSIIPFK